MRLTSEKVPLVGNMFVRSQPEGTALNQVQPFTGEHGAVGFGRVMVLVAHPDDESIACSGLLQRAVTSLVAFAVDGAPPRYGFEKRFGSLRKYSDARFLEASRALASVPHCSFRRLAKQDGTAFVDQHLFLDLSEAFTSLKQIAHAFSPDVLVSHAFEGGHVDHDACHILAIQTARVLGLRSLEFPLYWRSADGRDVFRQFREKCKDELVLQLSEEESTIKRQMLAEYRTQQNLTSVFPLGTERFRSMIQKELGKPAWSTYPFENRRSHLKTKFFFKKVAEFTKTALLPT